MKVILLRPWQHISSKNMIPSELDELQGVVPHLGLLYLAAELEKHRISVSIVDAELKRVSPQEPPARHLIQMEKYNSILTDMRVTTLLTSRGCPFDCSFCTNPPYMRRLRLRSPILVKARTDILSCALSVGLDLDLQDANI